MEEAHSADKEVERRRLRLSSPDLILRITHKVPWRQYAPVRRSEVAQESSPWSRHNETASSRKVPNSKRSFQRPTARFLHCDKRLLRCRRIISTCTRKPVMFQPTTVANLQRLRRLTRINQIQQQSRSRQTHHQACHSTDTDLRMKQTFRHLRLSGAANQRGRTSA